MFKRSQSRNFFKHRQIQNKISEKHKVITIGIQGTEKGVGVTHTALLIARYFSKQRGKVAVVEWGEQDAVAMIKRTYDGDGPYEKDIVNLSEPYIFKRVHYYQKADQELFSKIRRKGYQIMLIDFGQENDQNVFNQMDIQLVIGRANDWNYNKIEAFYQKFIYVMEEKYKNLILVLACGTKEEKKHMKQKIKGRIEILSYHKDPFEWNERMKNEIESILEL